MPKKSFRTIDKYFVDFFFVWVQNGIRTDHTSIHQQSFFMTSRKRNNESSKMPEKFNLNNEKLAGVMLREFNKQ